MPLDLNRVAGNRRRGCAVKGCTEPISLRLNINVLRSKDKVSVGGINRTFCEEHGVDVYDALEQAVSKVIA